MNIRILGNASWDNQYFKRPTGSSNKQAIWILIFNPGGTDYTVKVESGAHIWDENQGERELRFLNSRYRLLILKANPSRRTLPPGPFLPELRDTDTLAVTVTNSTTSDKDDDKTIIEIVDESLIRAGLAELDDDTLLRAMLDQTGDGTPSKPTY